LSQYLTTWLNIKIIYLKETKMSKPIQQTYEINGTPFQVFDALTNPETFQKWSGAPAKIDDQIGTEFSLFGGNIVGKNLEVIPNQKLVQDWSAAEGGVSHSKVIFTLVATGRGTNVELLHEGVPEASLENISQGWNSYYLGKIQEMFAE
jgi:uncharacterized protein YndB with AHSA1/START domain